ncbi:FMN-binding protein [Kitasatospora sp. NPDC051914]|uniref:FMN-binding protein n=1 Tax=Kitasatospora sp. NPDC051914 TaxID=3154945 RepID=UPI003420350D
MRPLGAGCVMRKKHPLRRAVLAGAGTISGIVLLLAFKPATDPALARAAGPGDPVASADVLENLSASGESMPAASGNALASPSAASVTATASAIPEASASRSASAVPAKTSSALPTPKTTSATSGSSGGSITRTVTGATVSTQYGPVQVKITLNGSTITGAMAVQSPSSTPRSKEISSTAVPQLNQRTLAAQSASIDSVSGATYTSAGYRQSLQSALDRAGV